MPEDGSPVWTGGGTPPNDGFFDPTARFVGAFGQTDWTAGWSTFHFTVPDTTDVLTHGSIPTSFAVEQNYPNPFNPQTAIRFGLPEKSMVTLKVFNLLGQQIALLINQEMQAGVHTIVWDAANQKSGVYIYQIKAGSKVFTNKMILNK
jgi:hypothetical protein